jgi:hypothetical protein
MTVGIEQLGVRIDVGSDLHLQSRGEHLTSTLTHELVEQRPTRGHGLVTGLAGLPDYFEHGRTFPKQRSNAGPDQSFLDFGSSSGRCARSRHLAEAHPQVLIIARLLALAQGAAEPQHQNLSDTPDPSVAGRSSGAVRLTASGSPPSPPRSDGSRTSIDVVAVDQSGSAASRVAVEIMRILRNDASTFLTDGSTAILGHVEAEWGGPAGSTTRGCIALVR